MDIGEEQPPVELPVPIVPEAVPEEPSAPEPERSVPTEQPQPERVPT